MDSIKKAFKSKEGRGSLWLLLLSIAIVAVGALLPENGSIPRDYVMILGALFSMVVGERLCRVVLYYQQNPDDDEE